APIAEYGTAELSIPCAIQNAMRSLPPKKSIASSIYFVASLHSRGSVRWSAIDKPSIQIGHKHLRIANGIGIDCEDVAVNHNQICALADLETAGGRLVLQDEGGINGIGVDRLGERNPLVKVERFLFLFATSRNGGLKGAERIIRGDVPVAATDDHSACLKQATRRIEITIAVGAEIRLERLFVRRLALGP